MMNTPDKTRLTVEQVALSSEYRRLTKRMQKWVCVYIQGFLDTGEWDPVKATQAAYTSANLNVARATTWRVKRHPQMKEVIDLFINSKKSPQELALEEMQRHLDAAEPGSVAAQRLLATKHALLRRMQADEDDAPLPPAPPEPVTQTAPAPAAPHRFKVGDIFTQDGVQYQTTSVDANGQPLTADEVK
jgi:hypothetical protein